MKVAYADPPYPGNAKKYPEKREVDHPELIKMLCADFPDGWALSTGSVNLQYVLSLCPPDVRIAAWVKPWANFKPGQNPGYAWEPVIWLGGRRKRSRSELTVRDWFIDDTCADWVDANITMMRGVIGAKPHRFCLWLFDLLGLAVTDELVDLFPGSRAVTHAWEAFCGRSVLVGDLFT